MFGSGDNVIPMIHVFDLCNILYNVASTKPERSYILAVDDGQVTLRDIVRVCKVQHTPYLPPLFLE